MAKDDISLGAELEKLEIEPLKIKKEVIEENPFIKLPLSYHNRNQFSRMFIQNNKCSYSMLKRSHSLTISKKKHNKILKEPILKLLQNHKQCCSVKKELEEESGNRYSIIANPDNFGLCALVDNCNQLRISSNEQSLLASESNDTQWWKNSTITLRQNRDVAGSSQTGSCSQQALNPPCDVTIDELASYFETLVHIPKKMSSMAEMMYI